MQVLTTLARPYAKAAFEYALVHQQLGAWSDFLQQAAMLVKQEEVADLLADPRISREQIYQLITEFYKTQLPKPLANFLHLLAEKKRLVALPQITALFNKLKAEYEQTVNAQISSAIELNEEQQVKLKQLLEKRLNKKVELSFVHDPALLGGMLIHAGDKVIDLSLNSQLQQLNNELRTA